MLCATYRPSLPWFVLLDEEGRWTKPRSPSSGRCGAPRAEVLTALRQMPTQMVAATTIRVLSTAASVRAGCGQVVKDVVSAATEADAAPIVGDPFAGGGPLRVCVYDNDPPDPPRTYDPVFRAGGVVTTAQRLSVVRALAASPAAPATGCTLVASGLAVVTASTSEATAYVELDGCQRIAMISPTSHLTLARADSSLTAQLQRLFPIG